MFSGSCAGLGVAGWVLMIGLWAGFLTVVVWAVTRIFPSATRSDEVEERLRSHVALDPDANGDRQINDQAIRKGSR
jgi:hypothetical protein